MAKKKLEFEVKEASDFKVLYVTGAFGGLDAHEGRIIFFVDRVVPKLKDKRTGAMEVGKIVRELQIELRMTPARFKSIAMWMLEHVKRFEKQFGKLKEEVRYIE